MESIEGKKMIVKMQGSLQKKGIDAKALSETLKELRPIAIEEEDPTLTKVIRLTFEHLEANGTFNIPIPAEIEINEEEGEEEVEEEEEILEPESPKNDEERIESLDYLFSIMSDAYNKSNREDLIEYRNMLML